MAVIGDEDEAALRPIVDDLTTRFAADESINRLNLDVAGITFEMLAWGRLLSMAASIVNRLEVQP